METVSQGDDVVIDIAAVNTRMMVPLHEEIPPFSNEFNRRLHLEIKRKEFLLIEREQEFNEYVERVSLLEHHLKNFLQEVLHSQIVLNAKKHEIETESHLKKLSEREALRVEGDIQKMKGKIEDFQMKLLRNKNNVLKANGELEDFKLKMNWNQEELENWALAAKQKEEDHLALERYKHADDAKIKALDLKTEKMSTRVQQAREELENEVTETQAAQIELDKTAEEFRKVHQERSNVVRQWDEATKAIHKREREVNEIHEEISRTKKHHRELIKTVSEQNSLLQAEKEGNRQVELSISAESRNLEKKRELLNSQSEMLKKFANKVELQKSELNKVNSDLKKTKEINVGLAALAEENQKKLDVAFDDVKQTKMKLENTLNHTDNLEEKAILADDFYKGNLNRLEEITKEEEVLKERLFQQSEGLFELRKQESNLLAEISGVQATSRNLRGRISDIDSKSFKQEEMLYNIDFQIQQLERKVSRASGERSHEETIALNKKIEELDKQLEEQNARFTNLKSQVKGIDVGLKATRRKIADMQDRKFQFQDRISELSLEIENVSLQIQQFTKKKEELAVKQDLKSLDLKKLKTQLNGIADKVTSLASRKLQMELAMEERAQEIGIHKQIQEAELKSHEQEKHLATVELRQRETMAEKLKSKYETLSKKLKASGDDEEERSQAYYIIQAAQTREEMKRKGDGLNDDIQKCEKEIRVLTKSLQHLNDSNQSYRDSFEKADLTGPEGKQRQKLMDQIQTVEKELREKENRLREANAAYEDKQLSFQEFEENLEFLGEEITRREKEKYVLEKSQKDQKVRLLRAQKAIRKLKEKFRKRNNLKMEDEETVEEKDFRLSELKYRNRSLHEMIESFLSENPQLKSSVLSAMKTAGVKFMDKSLLPSYSRPTTSSAADMVPKSEMLTET